MKTKLAQSLLSLPPSQWRVRQVVAFEWYDGPREGVCELEYPLCSFHFEIVAERMFPEHVREALFRLSEIPCGTVDRVIAILQKVGPARSPIWAPHGAYENEDEQQRIESELQAAIQQIPAGILIQTNDMLRILAVWSECHSAAEL